MDKKTKTLALGLTAAYAGLKLLARFTEEDVSIDKDNPYLAEGGNGGRGRHRKSFYEQSVKPGLDSVLSFSALLLLLPVYAAAAAAIYLDDPGPVLFRQKRVGMDKKFFMMSKFRTMKLSTPHDMPTHMLEHPEQYITRIGRFARRYSIDEICQLWDVFRGKLSLIGPRPALWNQADLIAERDRYGANDLMPGITGWAQINGRDELSIEEKARFDGEYAAALRAGSLSACKMDLQCLFGTAYKVLRHEGVHEGSVGGG